jgi:hypothetical protein
MHAPDDRQASIALVERLLSSSAIVRASSVDAATHAGPPMQQRHGLRSVASGRPQFVRSRRDAARAGRESWFASHRVRPTRQRWDAIEGSCSRRTVDIHEPTITGDLMTSIQPELWVDGAAGAVAFYKAAFGASVMHCVGEGDDIVAQLGVGEAAFWVTRRARR